MNDKLKYSFLFFFLFFFILTSLSQDDRDFRIGFKIVPALTWTKAKTSDVINNGTGVGFSFGAMADFKLSDNYYLTPELIVTTMSNRIKLKNDQYLAYDSGNYTNISYSYKVKYLEIPLLFKYKTNRSKDLQYWWQAGLSPGILIDNEVSTSAPPKSGSPDFPENNKYIPNNNGNDYLDFDNHRDDIVKARLAMVLGLGIEYHLGGNTSFSAGLRFNNGFTDILNDEKSKMINNVLGIELGFFF